MFLLELRIQHQYRVVDVLLVENTLSLELFPCSRAVQLDFLDLRFFLRRFGFQLTIVRLTGVLLYYLNCYKIKGMLFINCWKMYVPRANKTKHRE